MRHRVRLACRSLTVTGALCIAANSGWAWIASLEGVARLAWFFFSVFSLVPLSGQEHQWLGFFIIISCAVQCALGLLAHFVYNPARTDAPVFPDKVHWVLGRATLICALYNIYTGTTFLVTYHYPNSPWLLSLAAVLVAIWFALFFFDHGPMTARAKYERINEMPLGN